MTAQTLVNVNKIDENLAKMYQNQAIITTPVQEYVDRSDVLLQQMNFIAVNNRSFLNLK